MKESTKEAAIGQIIVSLIKEALKRETRQKSSDWQTTRQWAFPLGFFDN